MELMKELSFGLCLCAASRRHTARDPKCLSCLLFLTEAFALPFVWDFTAVQKKVEETTKKTAALQGRSAESHADLLQMAP